MSTTDKCPNCGDGLLFSDDRGIHCDGCDDFDLEEYMDSKNQKCPNCGSPRLIPTEGEGYLCGTRDAFQHPMCIAFAARQKAEAEVNDARANADSWRVQSDRFESQLLETSNQLAETRKQLEREESEHTLTIKQRDDAERAADRIAELILGVDSLGGDKYVWWANAAERFVELECELNKWRYSENLQPQADLAAAKAEVERWKAVGKAFWRAMNSPSDDQWDLLCEAQFAATTLIESERRAQESNSLEIPDGSTEGGAK